MDKIPEQVEKTRLTVASALKNPNLVFNVNTAAIQAMPDNEAKNAITFFQYGAFHNTFKAFEELCKKDSAVAWLQKLAQTILVIPVSAPQLGTDLSIAISVAEPVMTIQLYLRTSRDLRSGYSSRALLDAIQHAVPQLIVGAKMDDVMKSHQLEKISAELRQIIAPHISFQFDLFSIANMDVEACKNASEWIIHGACYNTLVPAIKNIVKVPSGLAWLSQVISVITGRAVACPDQSTDLVVQSALLPVENSAPVLALTFCLRTSRSLRSGYSARSAEDAIVAAVPALKTGKDMDLITQSQQIHKCLAALRELVGNSAITLDVDLWSIANMQPEDCHNATEFVVHGALLNTIQGALKTICKPKSGAAWMNTVPNVKVGFVAVPQQTTDLIVKCQVIEANTLQCVFYLRTSRSLRSAYSARAMEDALYEAIPQLKTGQDMDLVTESHQAEKTRDAVRELVGNPAITVECDLNSIASMPAAECHNAAEFIAHGALLNTIKGAVATVTKNPSGKAWLNTVPIIRITFVSAPQATVDLAIKCQVVDSNTLQCVFHLRTSRSLRSAYSARAMEDALYEAIPQLKTGKNIDAIMQSQQLQKVEQQLRTLSGNNALTVSFDLNSVASIADAAEQVNASEFVIHSALGNTVAGLAQCMKKANFAPFIAKFQSINMSLASAPQQSTDLVVHVASAAPPVLAVVFSLRTSRGLRSAYSARAFEEALSAAAGVK